ncbi:Irc23p [Saccharomyces eubayanus]|uniref:Irc23p n=1 Tax=Saccharomyces eubayanus TaxID=1080349 RepID=UPI0006C20B3C|nr:IRC23-like protein [Saccharomyces eubayanus]KOG96556.1 IRC23-like protein [Saccharomyces eubayanus]
MIDAVKIVLLLVIQSLQYICRTCIGFLLIPFLGLYTFDFFLYLYRTALYLSQMFNYKRKLGRSKRNSRPYSARVQTKYNSWECREILVGQIRDLRTFLLSVIHSNAKRFFSARFQTKSTINSSFNANDAETTSDTSGFTNLHLARSSEEAYYIAGSI